MAEDYLLVAKMSDNIIDTSYEELVANNYEYLSKFDKFKKQSTKWEDIKLFDYIPTIIIEVLYSLKDSYILNKIEEKEGFKSEKNYFIYNNYKCQVVKGFIILNIKDKQVKYFCNKDTLDELLEDISCLLSSKYLFTVYDIIQSKSLNDIVELIYFMDYIINKYNDKRVVFIDNGYLFKMYVDNTNYYIFSTLEVGRMLKFKDSILSNIESKKQDLVSGKYYSIKEVI